MASSPLYMEQYMESLYALPTELQKNVTLLKDLDLRTNDIMCNINKLTDDYVTNVNLYSDHSKKETRAYIERKFDKIKEYGDDKVQLATETYELVDKEIRKLDIVLARFEAKVKYNTRIAMKNLEVEQNQKQKNTNDKIIQNKNVNMKIEKETVTKSSKNKQLKNGTKKTNAVSLSKFSLVDNANTTSLNNSIANNITLNTSSLTGTAGAVLATDVLNMPVDPNEPTYCLCNQVFFGKMIECDNLDCPIEWFHFECVKLTTNPKGKWFCPKCRTDKKKK